MANQRHPDQTLVAFALHKDLLAQLDRAKRETDDDRSKFIRLAIVEKLQQLGIEVPQEIRIAPDRSGKKYPPHKPNSVMMNDASSKPVSAGKRMAAKAASAVVHKPDPK